MLDDVEITEEFIESSIQSAQKDIDEADRLSSIDDPVNALTKYEAAINSFEEILRLFIGEEEKNESQLTLIKDLLSKAYIKVKNFKEAESILEQLINNYSFDKEIDQFQFHYYVLF